MNPFAEHRELENALARSADRQEAERLRQIDRDAKAKADAARDAVRIHEALTTEPTVPLDDPATLERIKAAGRVPLVPVAPKPPFERPDLETESDRRAAGLAPLNDRELRQLMSWQREQNV